MRISELKTRIKDWSETEKADSSCRLFHDESGKRYVYLFPSSDHTDTRLLSEITDTKLKEKEASEYCWLRRLSRKNTVFLISESLRDQKVSLCIGNNAYLRLNMNDLRELMKQEGHETTLVLACRIL